MEREAPGGRETVSTEEVQETKVGSEMSCLLMVRLRLLLLPLLPNLEVKPCCVRGEGGGCGLIRVGWVMG